MKVLKGFALGVLSFLLFLSLTIFGLALIPNYTILNPGFVTAHVNRLDLPGLVQQAMKDSAGGTDGLPREVRDTLIGSLGRLEPELKSQVGAAVNSIYDYLLGKKADLSLAAVLGETVLSRTFVISVINQVPAASLARAVIEPQIMERMPPGLPLDRAEIGRKLETALARLEPALKEQARNAAGPVLDYLLGRSQTLRVTVHMGPVLDSVREDVMSVYLAAAPPEIARLPRAMQEQAFNTLWSQVASGAPSDLVIDEKMVGPGAPASIARALGQAETRLAEVKQYVGYFQAGFRALLALIIVLILAIVLIHHRVRDASRGLGILLATYGALELAGVLVIKSVAATQVTGLPAPLQPLAPQMLDGVVAPLQNFSLGVLIAGVALLIVSFVYRPRTSQNQAA